MVKIASKLTFGTEAVDWQERINMSRMREERAERARQIMQKYGVPAILSAGEDSGRYLTGLRGPAWFPQQWYVLFFAEEDPVVFPFAGWFSQLPDQVPWIKNWRIARCWLGGACGPEATREEAKMFASDIHQELQKRGLASERLAIVGFDDPAKEALRELDITLVDGHPLMLEARTIKTKDEINCLKMAAAICEVGWYKVWEAVKPGMRETELSRIATDAVCEAGAEESPIIEVRSGPLTFDRAFAGSSRIMQSGDLVYPFFCGVSYLGYTSCTYRTLIVGRKPNDREKEWNKKLVDRLDRVIDTIKPGNTSADAAKHFLPATNWGYQDEAELLTMEIGHGLGLGASYDLPIINRQWSLKHPQVFESGMAIAIEGREGESRVGGVGLENMLVVTVDGNEIIDHMPRDRILEPMHAW